MMLSLLSFYIPYVLKRLFIKTMTTNKSIVYVSYAPSLSFSFLSLPRSSFSRRSIFSLLFLLAILISLSTKDNTAMFAFTFLSFITLPLFFVSFSPRFIITKHENLSFFLLSYSFFPSHFALLSVHLLLVLF